MSAVTTSHLPVVHARIPTETAPQGLDRSGRIYTYIPTTRLNNEIKALFVRSGCSGLCYLATLVIKATLPVFKNSFFMFCLNAISYCLFEATLVTAMGGVLLVAVIHGRQGLIDLPFLLIDYLHKACPRIHDPVLAIIEAARRCFGSNSGPLEAFHEGYKATAYPVALDPILADAS
ncbi:MAG: hypothetical protein EB051_00410 [Chlamydiia bacterium]|nr:hypothetical protein [Chlamydiia bacterium]